MGENKEYKGKRYKIVSIAQMKHPITREWIDCVVYENEQGMVFVREYKEFFDRFK